MRITDLVWVGWFAIFLALELTSVFRWTPWQTLSATCWSLETAAPWMRFVLLVGIAVLLVHIVARWP
ncbi:MAG TPA: hypothetical protein VN088_20915 [Nocardioides sp.]|nr:hypothetical protein [Nocardioides sp.]